MAKLIKIKGTNSYLRVGRLTTEEERQLYEKAAPKNGFTVFHRPLNKDKNPKKPS